MALSEFAVRGAKGRDRPCKLVDERGLYLLVTPKAQRYWRFNYRFEGKQKTLAFGVYPNIGLADARERRDAARRLVAKGYDPALEEQRLKAERLAACNNSFRNVATEWLAKLEKKGRAKKTMSKTRWLLDHVLPFIGDRSIDEIKATDVLAALRGMEADGKYESARRLRSDCSRVLCYGIATGRCERDVAAGLLGALRSDPTLDQASFVFGGSNSGPGVMVDDSQIVGFKGINMAKALRKMHEPMASMRWLQLDGSGHKASTLYWFDLDAGQTLHLIWIERNTLDMESGDRGSLSCRIFSANQILADLSGQGIISAKITNESGKSKRYILVARAPKGGRKYFVSLQYYID